MPDHKAGTTFPGIPPQRGATQQGDTSGDMGSHSGKTDGPQSCSGNS